jgi:hypothetical protein
MLPVTRENAMTPKCIIAIVMMYSVIVSGIISPKPTVVAVTNTKYID